jgi:hypothetical protein
MRYHGIGYRPDIGAFDMSVIIAILVILTGFAIGLVFGNKPDGLLSVADLFGAFIAGAGYSMLFCLEMP